jgi:hypothetical protein
MSVLAMQRGKHVLHLFLGGIERSRIIDDKIGSFDFFLIWKLRRHPAANLSAGRVFRNSQPSSIAKNALFGMASHDNQSIETPAGARFQDQSSLNNGDGVRIVPANLVHPLVFARDHRRMNNFVEFLNPRSRAAGIAKRGLGQPRTVDASVRIQYLAPEVANDFLIDRESWLQERVRDSVRLNQPRAAFDKHLAHRGFAARDAAGKPESQQWMLTLVDAQSQTLVETRLAASLCAAYLPPHAETA